MGYTPAAITYVWDEVHAAVPKTSFGGAYTNKPGYHNCRSNLPPSDYSVQKPDDQAGDPDAGSALDITFSNVNDEIRLCNRLMAACTSGDRRVWNLREWFGTCDGVSVTGYDPRGGYYTTSDNSHLWHIHLSWYRKYCTDMDTARDIADVLLDRDGDDLNKEETMALISAAMQSLLYGGSHGSWNDADYAWIDDPNSGVGDRISRLEKRPDPVAEIKEFAWSYHFGADPDESSRWTHEAFPSLIGDKTHGVDDRLKRLE